MLHAEFCAWAHTLLGINVGALGSPSLSGETCQLQIVFSMGYVQLSPVAQSCLTICNPMDCSTPGLPVLHQLQKLAQTHVHQVSDSIQPSHPPIFPSTRVFPNDSVLYICWPKYWSFRFRFSASNEHSGLICFSIDWLDLLAVQGILKSLAQNLSSKPSIHCSPVLMVQLSHPYMTTGKIIPLIIQSNVSAFIFLILFYLTLQYCISFAIYQNVSAFKNPVYVCHSFSSNKQASFILFFFNFTILYWFCHISK